MPHQDRVVATSVTATWKLVQLIEKKQWNKKGESEEKKPDIVRVKKKMLTGLDWNGQVGWL